MDRQTIFCKINPRFANAAGPGMVLFAMALLMAIPSLGRTAGAPAVTPGSPEAANAYYTRISKLLSFDASPGSTRLENLLDYLGYPASAVRLKDLDPQVLMTPTLVVAPDGLDLARLDPSRSSPGPDDILAARFFEAHCRYLIDATGRRAFLARKHGARQIAADNLFAISLPIRGAPTPGIWTESAVDGWWNACCDRSQGTLSFYGSAASVRKCRRSLGEHYAQTRLSTLLPDLADTEGAQIRACGSARIVPAAGDGWIAVGDSAWTLQPLASAGISKALRDGARAARGLLGAAETYEQLQRTEFNGYLTLLREHHALKER